MIDSHCHLYFHNLKNNLPQIIKNANINKICSILSINTNPIDFEDHYNIIKNYKSIFISYGLHPSEVKDKNLITSDLIIKKCKLKKVIGIGETGLDFYHSKDYLKEQYKVFEQHIEASIINNLPLIIHQRNSENEIIDVLNYYLKNNNLKVVFHCFTGSLVLKNFCLNNNFFISLSGIITFKNAEGLRNIIKDFPLSSILLETDSPFLSPVPLRGSENEPANIIYIANYLSNFFKISLDDLISITDDNFYKLFSKAIRYNEISL